MTTSLETSNPLPTDLPDKAWRHHTAEIQPGLRLHSVLSGAGNRTLVLLHGFPQTWWEWRHVISPLAAAGFCVVAPDYRGAGNSSKPPGGYDKRTMASDLHQLLRDHLRVEGPVILVGHDIGLMVAYAFAQEYRQDVSHLIIIDAPLPGTSVFDRLKSDPRLWHFAFHGARDIAEMLLTGREREYLQAFFHVRCFNPSALDLDYFASAYSAPGAMRAGLELYRAFEQDVADNRAFLGRNGKLSMPTLALGGAISNSGPLLEEIMREVAGHVTAARVPNTGHWVPEENPQALLGIILDFLTTRDTPQ
jgi:pimeloyl-ACP methyl ester carboxylesterase